MKRYQECRWYVKLYRRLIYYIPAILSRPYYYLKFRLRGCGHNEAMCDSRFIMIIKSSKMNYYFTMDECKERVEKRKSK